MSVTTPRASGAWIRFGGVGAFAIGLASVAVCSAVLAVGDIGLTALAGTLDCAKLDPPATARVYSAHATWLAMILLEGIMAIIAVACAAYVLTSTGRDNGLWKRIEGRALIVLGIFGLAYHVHQIWGIRTTHEIHAFLTLLLSTVPEGCNLRRSICVARLVGEAPAGLLGVAMASSVVFALPPSGAQLATRLRYLTRLLYASSLLFVAGMLMSRANFDWVLVHWRSGEGDAVAKVVEGLIAAGTIQVGVAYSVVLAAFYLPARALLGAFIDSVARQTCTGEEARKKWLADHDLARSWQEDARQILALLAPVISAPIFDAIAK